MARVGIQTGAEWKRLRNEIQHLAQMEISAGRDTTTGVLVGGGVTRKTFPENAAPGDPTSVAFVANVRLLDFPGQPVARDVLVSSQARQLVADENSPVTVKIDKTGRLTIIGRAAITNLQGRTIDTYAINSIDGMDLSYLYGLEYVLFGDLPADVQAAIAAYRVASGLAALVAGSPLYIDPVVYVHGPLYAPGYIDAVGAQRGTPGAAVAVQQSVSTLAWNAPAWGWGSARWGQKVTQTIVTP